MALHPTFYKKLWDAVEIFYFGLYGLEKPHLRNVIEPARWYFKHWHELRNLQNITANPNEELGAALKHVGEIANAFEISDIFMPSPENGVELIEAGKIPNKIPLPDSKASLWRGVKADGLRRIPKGAAFAMLGGDCPVGILQEYSVPGKREICVAHICRENSICTPKRTGIADAMCNTFHNVKDPIFQAFTGCGIAAKHFSHPWGHEKYGAKNQEMTEFLVRNYGRHVIAGPLENGCVDLKNLWMTQLQRFRGWGRGDSERVGAMSMDTDDIDTYSDCFTAFPGPDCDPTDISIWGSNRRAGEDSRNLILVVNRG